MKTQRECGPDQPAYRFRNCFAPTHSGGEGVGMLLSDAQMRQQTSFMDWDFLAAWMICEGTSYPRLRWEGIECGGTQ